MFAKCKKGGRLQTFFLTSIYEDGEDPSSLFQKGGYKAIAAHLGNAQQIEEVYLQ